MARMYPPTVEGDSDWNNSEAERRLYEALRDYTPDSWLAFWSRPWARPGQEGESDFTVVHPDHGSLVIEVKGGRIRYEPGERRWYSLDRNGRHHRIKDPFLQARKSKHALLDAVLSAQDWDGQRVPLYAAVAFTDCSQPSGQLPIEWCAEQVIDRLDLSPDGLQAALLRTIEYGRGDGPHRVEDARKLAAFLARMWTETVEGELGFLSRLREESERLDRLTAEQADLALGWFGRKRRLALCGPAGSGKTYLAMEKARSLAHEGRRVLVVCFNKPLAQYLRDSLCVQPSVEVFHFHGLCEAVCERAGVALPDPTEQPQCVFATEWPERLRAAFGACPDLRYDGILVDEGQDFLPLWFDALHAGLREPGQSTFYVFYDDNQRVYGRVEGRVPVDGEDTFRLTRVVRNTRRIFDTCRPFYDGDGEVDTVGPQGREVMRLSYETHDEMRALLRDVVLGLLNEGVPPQEIVVLTPHALAKSAVMSPEPVCLPGDYQLTDRLETAGDVLVSTVHSFKGLERPFVVLVEVDRAVDSWDWCQQVCYVGLSRAKVGLAVIFERGVLEGALEAQPDDT